MIQQSDLEQCSESERASERARERERKREASFENTWIHVFFSNES